MTMVAFKWFTTVAVGIFVLWHMLSVEAHSFILIILSVGYTPPEGMSSLGGAVKGLLSHHNGLEESLYSSA